MLVQRARIPGNMLLRPAERCSTTTNATPLSGGIFSKTWRKASIPPAEAPIATRPSGASRLMTRPREGRSASRLDITGMQTDNYRAHRKHSHTTMIVENWPRRERGLLIFLARDGRWLRSAEVRATAIDVAVVACAVSSKY